MRRPQSRRRFCLSALATGPAVALAACMGMDPKQTVDPAGAFAGEPYPVRPVNRSRFAMAFRPARVAFRSNEPPGTIIVDTSRRQLYLIEGAGQASRYGIAVGAAGHAWKGRATVGRKARWPAWRPTDEMKRKAPGIPAMVLPGQDNPLGARALYLYSKGRDTLYRIHGTSEPWTIGTEASSGCIRMINEDIIALYDRVPVGAGVLVL